MPIFNRERTRKGAKGREICNSQKAFWFSGFQIWRPFAPIRVISRLRTAHCTGWEVALKESRITGGHVPMDGSL